MLKLVRTCHGCCKAFETDADATVFLNYCPPCDDLVREMVDDGRNWYDERDMLAEKREACGEYDRRDDDEHDEGGEA